MRRHSRGKSQRIIQSKRHAHKWKIQEGTDLPVPRRQCRGWAALDDAVVADPVGASDDVGSAVVADGLAVGVIVVGAGGVELEAVELEVVLAVSLTKDNQSEIQNSLIIKMFSELMCMGRSTTGASRHTLSRLMLSAWIEVAGTLELTHLVVQPPAAAPLARRFCSSVHVRYKRAAMADFVLVCISHT